LPHKPRVLDDPASVTLLDGVLAKLRNFILAMELKSGTILVKWLDKKMSYIRQEKTSASTAGYYSRGQIVHVDLGFNVGSEEGGGRFAVVLWTEANAGTVTVVPMTSQKADKVDKDEHRDYHVNLGEHLEDNTVSIIKVEQIRAVSKLRVRPLNLRTPTKEYKTDKLTDDQLDKLDEAIIRLYTRRLKEGV